MQKQEVLEVISNLRGRKNYEEQKSRKLGFNSLSDYIEDKLEKKSKVNNEKNVKAKSLINPAPIKKQNSCSCC